MKTKNNNFIRHFLLPLLFVFAIAAVSSCGGGGGTSGGGGGGSTSPTTPRTWKTAALIETDNAGGASSPQIAFDSSGNAIAVWYQYDGTRNNIWANRFD